MQRYNYAMQEALFGYRDVICEITDCYPDPYGQGYLYTYTFWTKGEEGMPTELLTVKDCFLFAQTDYDHDGTIELAIRTRWKEKPYTIYDSIDGELVAQWPNTVGIDLSERLMTPEEKQEALKRT